MTKPQEQDEFFEEVWEISEEAYQWVNQGLRYNPSKRIIILTTPTNSVAWVEGYFNNKGVNHDQTFTNSHTALRQRGDKETTGANR